MTSPVRVSTADQQLSLIDLQWQVSSRNGCPEDRLIQSWALASLPTESVPDDGELASIRIVDEPEMVQLNGQYRGKEKPTNVLSFPAELPVEVGLAYLGDILICASVVEAERREQGKAADAHWAHMVIHGMLHLQGYDHIDEQEAREMEQRETQLLAGLGYPDPYRPGVLDSDEQISTIIEVKQS